MKIDAHQHFWQFDPVRDAWINEQMGEIKRDFMPSDLKPILDENEMEGCIAVQADQSERETQFLLDLAAGHDWIKGVVGWVDLLDKDLNERLKYSKLSPKFKGVRHVLQAENQGFMTNDQFVKGVSQVGQHDLTYDILTTETQLDEVITLINKLPEMPLVIDHISKPDIKHKSYDEWASRMKRISEYKHVHVKISGMVTEADWHQWTLQDFKPYVTFCLDHFGPERLMFGSDWPVCLLAGSYHEILGLLKACIGELSSAEQANIFGGTATRFYDLVID